MRGSGYPGPLPPPPLTERPVGLLDLLGIKSGGMYPQHLHTELLPTADLLTWYLETQITDQRSNTINCAAIGLQTGLTVPSGEAWALRNLSFSVGADQGAATRVTVAHFMVRASLTASPITQLGAAATGAANGRPSPYWEAQSLVIAPPGAILGIWVQEVQGVSNLAGTLEARYSRLFL